MFWDEYWGGRGVITPLIPEEYRVGSQVVCFYRGDDPACNDYSSASAVQGLQQEDVVVVQEDPS